MEDGHKRPTAALPRPKFQPKIKGKVKLEPLPPPVPVAVKEKEAEVEDVAMAKEDEPLPETPAAADDASDPMEFSPAPAPTADEDEVIRRIDVFFNPAPLDEDTLLYVMQYPLRPSWRPYDWENCEQVRLKPKLSKMEVDFSVDVHSENYDPDVSENLSLPKQTLRSTSTTFPTDYAVGIIIGNQLYLNPVHAVVQLRPSIEHVNGVQKRKHSGRSQEATTSVEQREKVSEDSNEIMDDAEPWVVLEYQAADSILSRKYQQKMLAGEDNHIQFTMTPSDYVNSLCPGTSTSKKAKAPPLRFFLSMPQEERLKKWLTEVHQVNRFNALMHLFPDNSREEILKLIQSYADLVQGLWVSKSSLLYDVRDARFRDYILFLFSQSRIIHKDKLKVLKNYDDIMRKILRPLANERTILNDWKFKEDTDESFKKKYPHIVEEQNRAWSGRQKDIMDSLRAPTTMIKNSLNPNMAKRGYVAGKVDPGANRGKDGSASSPSRTMSNEAREALPKTLFKLFQQKKVHSLNSITRELRETAVSKSRLGKDDQEKERFVNAANGVFAPLPELKSIISEHAVDIHGLYVLKSGRNSVIDPLRDVVIKLFLAREPNAKLQKQEIVDAAKLSLKGDISDSVYNQVMNELCVNNQGSWMLKSGD